jgi:hypothetical protein
MVNKYFTVEVKPFIKASYQAAGSAAYSGDDVLFDWTAIQVPKGASRLISGTLIHRGVDGATQTPRDIDIYFAKSINGTAPATIGNSNATMSALPIVSNHIIGQLHIESDDGTSASSIDLWNIYQTGSGSAASMIPACVLEGEPNSGTNVGYDTIYVAGSTGGVLSFGTTVLTRGAVTDDTTLIVETDKGTNDDPNADLIFAVGDVIHTGTDDVLGTIGSIGAFDTNNQPITFTAPITDDLGDNEELFNVNPIRLILSFEK